MAKGKNEKNKKRNMWKEDHRRFILRCIELYESLPALWKKESEDYMNKTKKDTAMEKLLRFYRGKYPNATTYDVRRKINSLRTNFRKELNKIKQSQESATEAEELYESKLWYFEAMSFLIDLKTPSDSLNKIDDENEELIPVHPNFQEWKVNMKDMCRICGETTHNTNAKKLFDVEQKSMIYQIELLTGEWLNYEPNLPSYICICCEQDLIVATDFRERCLRTQKNIRHEQIEDAIPDYMDPLDNASDCYVKPEEDATAQQYYEDNIDLLTVAPMYTSSIKKANQVNQGRKSQQMLRVPIKEQATGKKRRINWNGLTEEQAREIRREQRRGNFVCDQCGRHFNDQTNFKMHLLRHTGVKAYKCKTCNQRFYTRSLLKRHEKLHTGNPEYHCRYCDKSFYYSNVKNEHERIHTDERPYECNVCAKTFTTSKKKRIHQLTHIDKRNFHCEICDKWFRTRRNLIAHNKSQVHKSNVEET